MYQLLGVDMTQLQWFVKVLSSSVSVVMLTGYSTRFPTAVCNGTKERVSGGSFCVGGLDIEGIMVFWSHR